MCIRQPGLEEFRIDTPRKIKKKAGFFPNIKTSKHQTRTRFGQVWRFQIFCKETHLLNRNSLMIACLFTEYIYIYYVIVYIRIQILYDMIVAQRCLICVWHPPKNGLMTIPCGRTRSRVNWRQYVKSFLPPWRSLLAKCSHAHTYVIYHICILS